MRVQGVQLLVVGLVTGCGAHLILGPLEGHPGVRHSFFGRPPAPHPLGFPPPAHYDYLPQPPVHHQPPFIYRVPQQVIVVRGVFPPFIERIVQRIQTYWSVYNSPDLLTPPPPAPEESSTTYRPPKKKVTTTTPVPPATTTEREEVTDVEAETTVAPQEDTSTKVSTLAVFEVTPTTAPEEPPAETPAETTTAPPDTEVDTEEPVFITPEKASLLGQKDAFLRFLQTGKVPPYLESDTLNEMDDIFT